MSFYDDASLVVIPSGYKTSKVYAEKPTDGSGDLTFTRTGDTATRVNSAGLIEKVRTNLILRSQEFNNASWTKSGVGTFTSAITTGFTDPTGGTNAQRYLATIASVSDRAFVRQLATLTNGIPYAISFWVKSNTGSSQDIYFMFQGGAVQATTATTSWQRISYSATTSTTSVLVGIEAKDLTTDILIYGFQLEVGDVATDYIPTTTAAVSVGPTANTARLDYLGSSCGKLLLEPQRTNLYNYSEQLNQWTASSATVTANYAVSPDGYTNADRVQFSAGGLLYIGGTGSAGENTLSVYAKATNGTSAKFRFFGNGNTTNSSDQTATGEWQRFTFTFTYSTATAGLKIATTGADDILFWGFQHEIGAYATSLIPTLAASATRGADACSKTGISSLIGQTEGVFFTEFTMPETQSASFFSISAVSFANRIIFGYYNGALRFYTNSSTGSFSSNGIIDASPVVGQVYKIAVAYKNNDFVVYKNGTNTNTLTTFTVPASLTDMDNQGSVGTGQWIYASVKQILLFPTRLTNAELAELTTL